MNQKEKLALLNTIPVIESDGTGKELDYALVEYNEENLEKLAQIVPSLEDYLKVADADNEKTVFDISMAAWDYAGATYFDGKTFISYANEFNPDGMDIRYTIFKNEDVEKYLSLEDQRTFNYEFSYYMAQIAKGRAKDKKNPFNTYLVVNVDEPYANEIVDILRQNGHWGT